MGTGWGCGGVHPRVKNFLRSTPKVKKVDTPTLIPPRWKKIGQIDPWGEHFFSFLFSKITPWWKGRREKILAAKGGRQIFWSTPTPSKKPCPPMMFRLIVRIKCFLKVDMNQSIRNWIINISQVEFTTINSCEWISIIQLMFWIKDKISQLLPNCWILIKQISWTEIVSLSETEVICMYLWSKKILLH